MCPHTVLLLLSRPSGISRARQDIYSVESQRRTAEAQAAGRFDAEIVPMQVKMGVKDKETGAVSTADYVVTKDEVCWYVVLAGCAAVLC